MSNTYCGARFSLHRPVRVKFELSMFIFEKNPKNLQKPVEYSPTDGTKKKASWNKLKRTTLYVSKMCSYKILSNFDNFNAINLKFLWIVDNYVTYYRICENFRLIALKLRPSRSKMRKNFCGIKKFVPSSICELSTWNFYRL